MTPTLYELTQLDGRKIAIEEGSLVAIVAGKADGGRNGCEVLLHGGFRIEVSESKQAVANKFHATIR